MVRDRWKCRCKYVSNDANGEDPPNFFFLIEDLTILLYNPTREHVRVGVTQVILFLTRYDIIFLTLTATSLV